MAQMPKVLTSLEAERAKWATEVMREKEREEARHLAAMAQAAKRLRNQGLIDEATCKAWQLAQVLGDAGKGEAGPPLPEGFGVKAKGPKEPKAPKEAIEAKEAEAQAPEEVEEKAPEVAGPSGRSQGY